MAILIIGMLALGLYMVRLPTSLDKLRLYGWHKEFGLLVLWLAILRISWRWMNVSPRLDIPKLERTAAIAVQWAFYGFMFAMPITGWLMTSAAGLEPSFFGLFSLPNLIAPNDALRHLFGEIHEWTAYGLIGTLILHICAALKHHLINKDEIFRRMI
jgi:cytochrome b561